MPMASYPLYIDVMIGQYSIKLIIFNMKTKNVNKLKKVPIFFKLNSFNSFCTIFFIRSFTMGLVLLLIYIETSKIQIF